MYLFIGIQILFCPRNPYIVRVPNTFMKFCTYCNEDINEYDSEVKWTMLITKRGQKIIEFECFHFQCWKEMWEESDRVALSTENLKNK